MPALGKKIKTNNIHCIKHKPLVPPISEISQNIAASQTAEKIMHVILFFILLLYKIGNILIERAGALRVPRIAIILFQVLGIGSPAIPTGAEIQGPVGNYVYGIRFIIERR